MFSIHDYLLRRRARKAMKAMRATFRLYEDTLPNDTRLALVERFDDLRDAIKDQSVNDLDDVVKPLQEELNATLPKPRWPVATEWFDVIVSALAVAFCFRAYYYEPFRIPTGSMQPTLYGVHFEPADGPSTWDKGPLRQLKWLVTGETYEEARVRASGIVTGYGLSARPGYATLVVCRNKKEYPISKALAKSPFLDPLLKKGPVKKDLTLKINEIRTSGLGSGIIAEYITDTTGYETLVIKRQERYELPEAIAQQLEDNFPPGSHMNSGKILQSEDVEIRAQTFIDSNFITQPVKDKNTPPGFETLFLGTNRTRYDLPQDVAQELSKSLNQGMRIYKDQELWIGTRPKTWIRTEGVVAEYIHDKDTPPGNVTLILNCQDRFNNILSPIAKGLKENFPCGTLVAANQILVPDKEIQIKEGSYVFLDWKGNDEVTLVVANNADEYLLPDDIANTFASTPLEQGGLPPGTRIHAGQVLWRGYVKSGDFLFVNRWIWNFRHPRLGETIVFSTRGIGGGLPDNQHYIKRLCGRPGDTVELKPESTHLYVNGAPATNPNRLEEIARHAKPWDGAPPYPGYKPKPNTVAGPNGERIDLPGNAQTFTLGPGEYLALGDNSDNSLDSRYWGKVPAKNLLGPATFVHWPFTSPRWGFIR